VHVLGWIHGRAHDGGSADATGGGDDEGSGVGGGGRWLVKRTWLDHKEGRLLLLRGRGGGGVCRGVLPCVDG